MVVERKESKRIGRDLKNNNPTGGGRSASR
jgi:hypothetical protein